MKLVIYFGYEFMKKCHLQNTVFAFVLITALTSLSRSANAAIVVYTDPIAWESAAQEFAAFPTFTEDFESIEPFGLSTGDNFIQSPSGATIIINISGDPVNER